MIAINNIRQAFGERWLKINTKQQTKDLEKLSSGYKINRAADDASGLAISEKMRAQIAALDTAAANSEDGISLIQTAEGYLNEVHSMLNRCVELSLKSANGIMTDGALAAETGIMLNYAETAVTGTDRYNYDESSQFGGDRAALEMEFRQLKEEIDRISKTANFNNILLFDGSLSRKMEVINTLITTTERPTVIPETTPPVTITIPGGAATSVAKNTPDIELAVGFAAPTEVAKNTPDKVLIPPAATPPTVTFEAPGVVTTDYSYTIPSGTPNPVLTGAGYSMFATAYDIEYSGTGNITLLDNNAGVSTYITGDLTPTINDNHGTIYVDTGKMTRISGNNGTINVYGSSVTLSGENHGTINIYGGGVNIIDEYYNNTGGTINRFPSEIDLTDVVNPRTLKIEAFPLSFYGTKVAGTDTIAYIFDRMFERTYEEGRFGGDYHIFPNLSPEDLQVDGYFLSYEDSSHNPTTNFDDAAYLLYTPIDGFVRLVPKSGMEELDWLANKFSSVSKFKNMESYERKYIQDLMNSDWLPSGEGVTIGGVETDINAIKKEIHALMGELNNPDGSLKSVSDSDIGDITERINSLINVGINSQFKLAAGTAAITVPTSGTAEIDWLLDSLSSPAKFRSLSKEERAYMYEVLDNYANNSAMVSGEGLSLTDENKADITSAFSSTYSSFGYLSDSSGTLISSYEDDFYKNNIITDLNTIKSTMLAAAPKVPTGYSDPIPTSGTAEIDWMIDAFSDKDAFKALSNEERAYMYEVINNYANNSAAMVDGVGLSLTDANKTDIKGKFDDAFYWASEYFLNSSGTIGGNFDDDWSSASFRVRNALRDVKSIMLSAAPPTANTTKEIPTSGSEAFKYFDNLLSDPANVAALSTEEKDAIVDNIVLGNTMNVDFTAFSTWNSLWNDVFSGVSTAFEPLRNSLNSEKIRILAALPGIVKTTTITTLGDTATAGGLKLQIGETSQQADKLTVEIAEINSTTLGLADLSLLTQDQANAALTPIRTAVNKISMQRAQFGAWQNRLEYTINNLETTSENISNANSRIRDTDIAKQMSEYAKDGILVQAAQSMLAQANQLTQSALSLIG